MLRRTSGKRGVASRVYPPGASHSPTAACPVPCTMFADRCLTCTLPCPVRALSVRFAVSRRSFNPLHSKDSTASLL